MGVLLIGVCQVNATLEELRTSPARNLPLETPGGKSRKQVGAFNFDFGMNFTKYCATFQKDTNERVDRKSNAVLESPNSI